MQGLRLGLHLVERSRDLLAALVAIIVVLYNRLVRSRNRVNTAWSDIDVQLQRRHDLVPQLVKAVDAYAKYEKATLEAVTELRAEAMRVVDDMIGPFPGVHELTPKPKKRSKKTKKPKTEGRRRKSSTR